MCMGGGGGGGGGGEGGGDECLTIQDYMELDIVQMTLYF